MNAGTGGSSEYERLRLENMKRNEEFLQQLGFGSGGSASASTVAPKKKNSADDEEFVLNSDENELNQDFHPRKKRTREPVERTRQSSRVRGVPVDTSSTQSMGLSSAELTGGSRPRTALLSGCSEVEVDDDSVPRHKVDGASLRAFIESQSALHSDSISNQVRSSTGHFRTAPLPV